MTNTLKHTNATDLWVEILSNNETVKLSIKDNGHLASPIKIGNGLKGMQERVASINGTIEFRTDNHSLQIDIEVPKLPATTSVLIPDSDSELAAEPQLPQNNKDVN